MYKHHLSSTAFRPAILFLVRVSKKRNRVWLHAPITVCTVLLYIQYNLRHADYLAHLIFFMVSVVQKIHFRFLNITFPKKNSYILFFYVYENPLFGSKESNVLCRRPLFLQKYIFVITVNKQPSFRSQLLIFFFIYSRSLYIFNIIFFIFEVMFSLQDFSSCD